ncbi:MAG TPA: P-loop NTPase, partial [Candidatus Angelobacter sp.]|nr:P-loop NTPase [Candidatus Angelobacter sp.]
MSSHTHSHGPAPAGPQPLPGVDSIIAVGSGKGGVGKTTLAVNLAIALARMGFKVGLLDADVYGPNVPTMLGTTVAPEVIEGDRILPPERYGLKVISVGFLSPGDKPLVWRGPMLHSIIKQFLGQVEWGQLDYLIIDLPPGTGDVVISLVQTVPLTGAVVVTTPSDVSLQDARKA